MKTSLSRLILLTGLFFSGIVVLNSCSKADAVNSISSPSPSNLTNGNTTNNTSPGKIANLLFDHDLMVTYAKDNGTDITANFKDLTFHFSGYPDLSGYGWAANDLFAVNGNWYRNKDLTQITFYFPTNGLAVLAFWNKDWNVVSYNDPVILTAANGENDELHLDLKK